MKTLPRRCRTVAIVGVDGAGKSTQAKLLCALLRRRGARVISIHPFGRPLFRFLPKASITTDRGEIRRPAQPTLIDRMVALIDVTELVVYLWLMHAKFAVVARLGRRPVWLVSDRSVDSVLAKHRRLRSLPALVLSIIEHVGPRCETTIWLRIEPRVAMLRDRDFALSYYEELDAEHAASAQRHGWHTVAVDELPASVLFASVAAQLGLGAPSNAP